MTAEQPQGLHITSPWAPARHPHHPGVHHFRNNTNLDGMGFAPFGQVVSGIEVVDKIYTGYGEAAPRGSGPPQARVANEGNAYLKKSFLKMDYIKTATIEPQGGAAWRGRGADELHPRG
ncbi:MAG: hypothetical protein R2708_05200 [Vicinamibacterales bacterium]